MGEIVNPLALMGGGGLQSSASSSATNGDASSGGTTGTGAKNINFGGGNPNTMGGFFSNPVVLVAVVAGVYFIAKAKK